MSEAGEESQRAHSDLNRYKLCPVTENTAAKDENTGFSTIHLQNVLILCKILIWYKNDKKI